MSGLPLCTLLGGNHQDDILLYRAISQGTPQEMAQLIQKYKSMVCLFPFYRKLVAIFKGHWRGHVLHLTFSWSPRTKALWFRMKPFRSENKKKKKICLNWQKSDSFHIYILQSIQINL